MNPKRKNGALSALALVATAGLATAGLTTTAATTAAASPTQTGAPAGETYQSAQSQTKERPVNYDSREGTAAWQAARSAAIVAKRGPAFASFTKTLGHQAIVDLDPLTGTPRNLGRLDGYLTGPSTAPAKDVALGYVRDHAAVLGLTTADLDTLRLRNDYVDPSGIHHLSWTQGARGLTVFSNGLKANVTKDGRLISIQGSPISGLAAKAGAISTTPRLSASQARTLAVQDVHGHLAPATVTSQSTSTLTRWSNHDQAQLVWFDAPTGLRLAWSTYTQGGSSLNYQHVIDAQTGKVLYRHDTTNFDAGDARVFSNYPGAPVGGTPHLVNFYRLGYLPRTQHDWLRGTYAIAWADVNDNDQADTSEKVPVPGGGYKFVPFRPLPALCSRDYRCSWNPSKAYSWKTNMKMNVDQAFYYDSAYHDYLMKPPFGFTPKAGNFELQGGDPVLVQALDGAAVNNGLPDGNHIDNANMSTPPDGIPPTMQMYLWHYPHTGPKVEPYVATESSWDPSVILHEYTHGLSNRLVVDAQGNSTLNSIQAGAMGEAWSDYYAMDYLVTKGLEQNRPIAGDVREGKYIMANKATFRTEAIDCPVHTTVANGCTDIYGNVGGYTYGDFPTIGGTPEVHSSGELWSQALWSLRMALGHDHADTIITRGMSLAPSDPSMLDMRNAILQANNAAFDGQGQHRIWGVFKTRGMGWYAGTLDAGDTQPRQDFSMPPSPETPRSTVFGTVTDKVSGKPIGGALVAITGHNSGYTGDYTAVTNANGTYQIPDVYIGKYQLAVVTAPGYEVISGPLKVVAGATKANFSARQDYAAANGGGVVTDFNGPDYSAYGCGPGGAIDLSLGTGWGSTTGDDAGDPTNKMKPKFVEIRLSATTDVTSFAVNPSNTCGDPGSSSTGKYKIQTSPDGKSWSTAVHGRFGTDDRGHLVEIGLDKAVSNVRYVKFWMLSPQVPDFHQTCPEGNYGGCQFTDMTEIEVFGK